MSADGAARAALDRAVEQGIHRLVIPTPFAVGSVNAWLIEDDPLTLVDSGPNSALAFDALERSLGELGHGVGELGLLIVTHQHPDHVGLADVLRRRSGAELAALTALGEYLARYDEAMEYDDRFAERVMLRHGIDRDIVTALRAVTAVTRGWGTRAEVGRGLRDGERITLRDRTLEVLHRPGHSPSDTLLWDAGRGTLLVADHLLAHISSNPVISRPLEAWTDELPERPHSLRTYLDSLGRTREMPAQTVLTGHGDPVTAAAGLIDERVAMHARRAERIHAILAEQGPCTAHEIGTRIWGRVALTQAYLTLSEVLGHLDLLIAEGRVQEQRGETLTRFATCDAGG